MGTNGSVESHSLGKPNVCGQIVVVFDREKSTNVPGSALMHRPMEIVPRTRSLHSTTESRIYGYCLDTAKDTTCIRSGSRVTGFLIEQQEQSEFYDARHTKFMAVSSLEFDFPSARGSSGLFYGVSVRFEASSEGKD